VFFDIKSILSRFARPHSLWRDKSSIRLHNRNVAKYTAVVLVLFACYPTIDCTTLCILAELL